MKETKFQVEGMRCGTCQEHVKQAVGAVSGVLNAEVDLGTGTVRVDFDETKTTVSAIQKAILDAGYEIR